MFARRVRTGPAGAAPPAGEDLSECLLVEGSGNAADDAAAAADATAMFDGMVIMQELPEQAANPAASSEGGSSLYGQGELDLGPPPSLGEGMSLADAKEEAAPPQKGGLFAKFGKKPSGLGGGSAPKAQAFTPEMLASLGMKMNDAGELEDAEVAIPPGVTEEAVEQCMAMGFNKALSVGWLSATNNNTEQALEHLLKGDLPPKPGDRPRPNGGGAGIWDSGGGYPGGQGGGQQLPAGWQQRVTADGRPFFVDHNTQQTHWQLPGGGGGGGAGGGGGGGGDMVTMELTVPPGAIGGQLLTVTGPTGRDVSMMLPQGARPGMKVRFKVPVEQVRPTDAAGQPTTVKLEVVVPHGAWPGQPITVQAPNGEHIQVQLPIGASTGLSIQFDVDARYGRPPEKVTMRVTLPPGCMPGQLLTVAKPGGSHVQVQVPNGAMPGHAIEFQV